MRSVTGRGKSELNGEVNLLEVANLNCIIQFGTERG